MVNTEKPQTKNQKNKQGTVSPPKVPVSVSPVSINGKTAKPKAEVEAESKSRAPEEKAKTAASDTKDSKLGKKPKTPKVKRSFAVVNATGLPISTKYAIAICRFVKNKKIEKAIKDLEEVALKKKVIAMKGEIAHKKGKGIMSGKYPKKASENFIMLLKSLLANANANEIEDPIVTEAIANLAQRPFGKQGRVRRKRTHVKLVAKAKKLIKKSKQNKKSIKKKSIEVKK